MPLAVFWSTKNHQTIHQRFQEVRWRSSWSFEGLKFCRLEFFSSTLTGLKGRSLGYAVDFCNWLVTKFAMKNLPSSGAIQGGRSELTFSASLTHPPSMINLLFVILHIHCLIYGQHHKHHYWSSIMISVGFIAAAICIICTILFSPPSGVFDPESSIINHVAWKHPG